MVQLNQGFSDYDDDSLFHKAVAIVAAVGGIAVFASLKPLLPPITDAANALEAAIALPAGPVREQTIAATRATLIGLLQHLADALMDVDDATDADLAGTQYDLRKANTHTSAPPDAPQNVRVKTTGISGQLQVIFGKVPRAVFYEVEWTLDPVNGPWTLVPAFNSTRGMVLEDLTRGKDYYIHARAVATGANRGPWSGIASGMVM